MIRELLSVTRSSSRFRSVSRPLFLLQPPTRLLLHLAFLPSFFWAFSLAITPCQSFPVTLQPQADTSCAGTLSRHVRQCLSRSIWLSGSFSFFLLLLYGGVLQISLGVRRRVCWSAASRASLDAHLLLLTDWPSPPSFRALRCLSSTCCVLLLLEETRKVGCARGPVGQETKKFFLGVLRACLSSWWSVRTFRLQVEYFLCGMSQTFFAISSVVAEFSPSFCGVVCSFFLLLLSI